MPSPSTSTLRSGTKAGSRLSGGGALELSWMTRLGACCWNGAKKSPPNQPPPLLRGAGRDQPPPKLNNCAEAGPAMPTRIAMATASAISGPLSVNTRKNDFGCRIRLGRNGLQMDCLANAYSSGKRPQAGGFSPINGAVPPAVKGGAKSLILKVTLAAF